MTARTATVVSSKVGQLQFGNSVNKVKVLYLETPNTMDATDTLTVTYSRYGITTVHGIAGFKHTTDNEVIVTEAPTTSVTASVMTITVPGGTDNDPRIYLLFYE